MSSPVQPPLRVETVDGTTSGRPITTIKVTNGDLSISGSTATIDTSGGGGGGSGTVTSIVFSSPLTGGTITTTGTVGIPEADGSTDGYLSSTVYNTFDGKQDAITLTTTGSSGVATFTAGTLNIPNYTNTATIGGSIANSQVAYGSGANTIQGSANLTFDGTNLSVGGYVKSGTGVYDTNGATDLTLQTNSGTDTGKIVIFDGAGQDIEITPNGGGAINLDGLKWPNADGSANQVLKTDGAGTLSFTDAGGSGTVTSIATSAPITGGTITTTGTIGIALADSTTDGYLSSTDWNTFNGKQDSLTLTTTGTSGAATLVGATLNIPQYSGGGSGTVTVGTYAGANNLAYFSGATEISNTNNISINAAAGSGDFFGQLQAAKFEAATGGAEATPAFTFSGDDNTGMFSSTADTIDFSVSGDSRLQLSTTELKMGNGSENFKFSLNGSSDSYLNMQNGSNVQLYSSGGIYLNANASNNLIRANAVTTTLGNTNVDAVLTTQGTGDLTLSTNSGTNSGTIAIKDGAGQDIEITPNGGGAINLDGLKWPTADGSANQVLKTDGAGTLSFTDAGGGGSGLDTTPNIMMVDAPTSGSNKLQFPLFAQFGDAETSSNTAIQFNTTTANLIPFFAPKTGDVSSITCKITAANDDDVLVSIYDSDSSNLPNDRIGDEATWNMGASGEITLDVSGATDKWDLTKGELYYLALMMATDNVNRPTFFVYDAQDGGGHNHNIPSNNSATATYRMRNVMFNLSGLTAALPSSVDNTNLTGQGGAFYRVPIIGVVM